ncbi:hypothetical protein Q7P37_010671 [Cladosporium fusiforme]
MHRKSNVPFPISLLALLPLALIFSTITLAFAARTLALFNAQQSTNPWLLPVWRGHFDLRGLRLVVGTSAVIVLLDGVAALVLLLRSIGHQQAYYPPLLALPAAVLPLVLNARAPAKDTLQSWTCGWVSRGVGQHDGLPGDFGTVCGESRFATYAPLALLFLHLALLALSLLALQQARETLRRGATAAGEGDEDGEKMVELGEYEKMSKDKA